MSLMCPYCIRTFKNPVFRCSRIECGQTIQPTRGELVQLLVNGKRPKCREPACDGAPAEMRCPYPDCGKKLPNDFLQYRKDLRFSILGTTGAGKSNYLTMLIYLLRNLSKEENPSDLQIAHVDLHTLNDFNGKINTILNQRRPVEPTKPEEITNPQLWRIHSSVSDPVSVTVFDGAGEQHERATEENVVRYIRGSRQFILVVDPLSISSLRRTLTKEQIAGSAHEDDDQQHDGAATVAELGNLLRSELNMSVNQKLDLPAAVVLTKLDLFMDQLGRSTVTKPSPHTKRGGFVESDSIAVDREIREWLRKGRAEDAENDGERFLRAVDSLFSNVRYFGVSSFGHTPSSDGVVDRDLLRPHRVLDPLMWMLAQEKVLPVL